MAPNAGTRKIIPRIICFVPVYMMYVQHPLIFIVPASHILAFVIAAPFYLLLSPFPRIWVLFPTVFSQIFILAFSPAEILSRTAVPPSVRVNHYFCPT
jgi:hypothetical protein